MRLHLLPTVLGVIVSSQACMTLPTRARLNNPDKASDTRFAGIDSLLKTNEVRVLVMHGMGSHDIGYSRDFQKQLKRELLLEKLEDCKTVDSLRSPFGTQSYTSRCAYVRGNRQLIVYEFTWSQLTKEFEKIFLQYDWQDHGSERVFVNRLLKRMVIDQSFSDAVTYAGTYAPTVQRATRRAICVLMTDGLGASEDCEFDKARSTPTQSGRRPDIVSVSHSLGSMIVFETLQGMIDDSSLTVETVTAKEFVASLSLVGMFANQLPLLWLSRIQAGAKPTPSGEPESRMSVLSGNSKVLPIVAVSDPNDLLTFPLDKGWPRRLGKPDARVINARVSNSATALLTAVNPATAHTGYWTNRCSVRLLTHGSMSCSSPWIFGLHRVNPGYRPDGAEAGRYEADFGKLLLPNASVSVPLYTSVGAASAGVSLALSVRSVHSAFQVRSNITRTFDRFVANVPTETLVGVGMRLSLIGFTVGVDFQRGDQSRTYRRWSIGTGW